MFHITSLNPEIMVLAHHDEEFKKIVTHSSLNIIDGVGVFEATKLLKIDAGERYAGVDLMEDIMKEAGKRRLRTVLIGGKVKLAKEIADCYNKKFDGNLFEGVEIPQNISGMNQTEKNRIISHISALKPRILFVAFGSPKQEKWIEANRASFTGMVCMGVGGGFDFLGGRVRRAPKVMRALGLEWLFRLILQPWRIKRQVRLIEFAIMTIREKIATYGRR